MANLPCIVRRQVVRALLPLASSVPLLGLAESGTAKAETGISAGHGGAFNVVPPPTENPSIDRPNLQTAFASGQRWILSPGNYVIDEPLTLARHTHIWGNGHSNKIIAVHTDGRPAVTSDPSQYLSGVQLCDLSFDGPGTTASGGGVCLKLFAPQNQFSMERVRIRFFPGNAIEVKGQTKNPHDLFGFYGAVLNNIFIVDCGGYGIFHEGRGKVKISMYDFNSHKNGKGALHLKNLQEGWSNFTLENLTGGSGMPGKVDHVIFLEDCTQAPTFIGCGMTHNPKDPSPKAFIRTTRAGRSVLSCANLIGCSGVAFANWIIGADGTALPFQEQINHLP